MAGIERGAHSPRGASSRCAALMTGGGSGAAMSRLRLWRRILLHIYLPGISKRHAAERLRKATMIKQTFYGRIYSHLMIFPSVNAASDNGSVELSGAALSSLYPVSLP